MEMRRCQKGFTLAELLIVVAIIAVLVAISIPIFNSQLEKSRRAVDLHTARTIESVLANAVNDGTIQFPSEMNNSSNCSVFVVIARDKDRFPSGYINTWKIAPVNGTLYCGADNSVRINTATSTKWNEHQPELQALLTNSGLNINSLKVTSKSANDDGWDWIIVNVGYVKKVGLVTRIYSGDKKTTGNAEKDIGKTNIEKLINKQ